MVHRTKNDKLDPIEIQTSCSSKDTTKKMKRQATMHWEKIATFHISDRDLDQEYINNSYSSTIKRQ